ncbi:MAG: SBBP repeat-containing protein [Bacteroidota bacterium]
MDQYRQVNDDVLFLYSGKGLNVQLRKTGYSYELFSAEGLPPAQGNRSYGSADLAAVKLKTARVDIDFYGMNARPTIMAYDAVPGPFNYYIDGKEITGVNSYQKVIYENIYDHIDIEFVLQGGPVASLKYNLILHPGADLGRVRFLAAGFGNLIAKQDGSITYTTPLGDITETIPMSFYTDAPSENIPVHFHTENSFIRFQAEYNKQRTFIIDPSTNRIWGTYYGDAATDYCNAVSADAQNNIYITGYTLNTTNIATSGTYQSTLNGSFDAYLVKFNANGVRQWGTYFGGNSVDAAYGIFITPSGYIYICGDTFSTGNVASTGAHQTTYGGGIDDAFLAKFDSNGIRKWSTYYGGMQHDIASSVTVDNNENVIMCGHTESLNAIATPSAYQNSWSNLFDVFIVKFDSAGLRQWGTYYGDAGMEEAWALDCDAANNIYITGFTTSTSNIATPLSHQSAYGGGTQDAYAAKFNPSGTALLWATYYGGTGSDQGSSIKLDNNGNIFVAGNTTSANAIATGGAYQQSPGSADDAFIVRFNSAGVRQWGTYFGGNDVDYIAELHIVNNTYLLFCGSTQSTNAISTPGAYQALQSSPGNYDAYFAKFSGSGSKVLGTYYGGTAADNGRGLTFDNTGKIYLAGETYSTDSIASAGAHMVSNAGGGDAFLAKFCLAPEPLILPGDTLICTGDTLTLAVSPVFSSYLWSNSSTTQTIILTDTSSALYNLYVTVSDGFGCTGTSDTVTVIFDVCNTVSWISELDNLLLYPVPAGDVLQISVPNSQEGWANMEIYSMSGELALSSEFLFGAAQLDISGLSPGAYLLVIKDRGLYGKFIKR